MSEPSTLKVIAVITLAFSDPSIPWFDLCPGRCSYMLNYDLKITTITVRLLHQLMVQHSPAYHEISTYLSTKFIITNFSLYIISLIMA